MANEYCRAISTLYPGDVISGGTVAGNGGGFE